jgi:hypothetical protein
MPMKEYPKIETIFNRDTEGTKKLIPGSYRSETIEALSDLQIWAWTEKIDGMNIRIHWDGHKITFAGRTDNSQIAVELINWLNDKFINNETEELFEQKFGETEVTLYGEGYGRKIQKGGGNYIPDGVSFILFDVLINDIWLTRESVEDIAKTFAIDVVPNVGFGYLDEAVEYVKSKPNSKIGTAKMEGVVCRPIVELFDRTGHRLIVKIKACDFE